MSIRPRPLSAPFTRSEQLVTDLDNTSASNDEAADNAAKTTTTSGPRLPGHPRIRLSHTTELWRFLREDLDLRDLETLAPRLWMMSTHSRNNISALHRQRVKGRTIVVAEDHRLHLVWYYDKIFIKPLPRYLLSAAFWEEYLCPAPLSCHSSGEKQCQHQQEQAGQRETIRRAAAGLLYSYTRLIRHESDFRIARQNELGLIPPDTTWEALSDFLELAARIRVEEVAERYQYGEIRLSRLNFYTKLFLRKMAFQRVHGQYGAYFAKYYGPLLFVFAVLSVLLAALQVELQAEPLIVPESQWPAVWQIGRYFSVITLLVTAATSLWLVALLVYKICNEWVHAFGGRNNYRRECHTTSTVGTQTGV